MKKWTKLSALLLAILMITLVGTAYAGSTDGDLAGDGIEGDFTDPDTPSEYSGVVIMYKEITAYNPETCTVNAPTVTYSYGIAAGETDKDIYDAKTAHDPEANVHTTTKAGVGEPTISGSVDGGTTWISGQLALTPSVQLDASSAGKENMFKLKVDFSSIDFKTAGSGAGVYRYVITETCTTKEAAGIKDGDISDVRYMDVYVDGKGTVYGYVCFQNNNSIDARDDATTNTVTEAAKTEGFVATDAGGTDGATPQTADAYYTFNFEVGKEVENDAYAVSTKHKFPFHITLANSNVTAYVLPIMTITGDATQTALTAGAIAKTWTPTIADGAVISYVGIPCGTTVTIYETNDVAGVTYASVSENADTDAEAKDIVTGVDSNNAIINCGATALSAATENHTSSSAGTVTFTNTMLQISPTGLVIRFAPYGLLLIGGIALLFIALRHRKHNEEE